MAVKISSAHFGWLCSMKREHGQIVEVHWNRNKENAWRFPDAGAELEEMHGYLYDRGIMHDMVTDLDIPKVPKKWFGEQTEPAE